MSTHTRSVRITVEQDDELTHVDAVLSGWSGSDVRAVGLARRRSGDAPVPEIGEELAVARALYALADRLMDVANTDLANMAHAR